ncbi:MAG TPA: aminotransferase class V-fold PLP-dependent enzyme [Thiotrichales bacterium]|nr:aminotransferase class V-fold PLP-dependent enzyme [Thiotrichales bacterium]
MQAFDHFFQLDPALHHLNHAAVAPWPIRTVETVTRFAMENGRIGSLEYDRWLETEQRLRARLQRLIHARGTDEIALLKNTSEGLSFIAQGLDWRAGDNVVITDQEFPSNRIVWEALAERGVETRAASLGGSDPETAICAAIDDRTRLVSVSAVQYATGLRLDLKRIGRECERRQVLFCIDAIQALGAETIDVREVRADFVVADGHKWMLGPEGVALFYCRRELIPALRLTEYGWHMTRHPGDFDRAEWAPAGDARRFECGSPNMLGIHALDASLSVLEEAGIEKVREAVLERTHYLAEWIERLDGFEIVTPLADGRHLGILSLRHETIPTSRLHQALSKAGVLCALRGGLIRLSPHFHTRTADLDAVIRVLQKFENPSTLDV